MILMGGNGREAHFLHITRKSQSALRELFWFCGGTGTPNMEFPNTYGGAFLALRTIGPVAPAITATRKDDLIGARI